MFFDLNHINNILNVFFFFSFSNTVFMKTLVSSLVDDIYSMKHSYSGFNSKIF